MPQSLAQIYLHIIYSTKHRQPFLTDATLRAELHAYLAAPVKISIHPPSSSAASRITFTSSAVSRARTPLRYWSAN
jgi:hypothetical protein